ncbi:MAG: heme ABC transporter ATP-binding protein [Bacteroidota bacterium]
MLALDTVRYTVGKATLVESVSLAVAPGEVVAVVGANGAGKTTLLRLASGDLAPSAGTVRLDGRTLRSYPPDGLARQRAVLPQSTALTFGFTAREVVLLGRTPHAAGQAQDDHIADQALHLAGVTHLAERSYPTLSGGEQQRVHFARALAQLWENPSSGARYLLLDEPTASLDPAHQHAVLGVAQRCAEAGVGVLAVLHNLNLAAFYADRIAVLRRGHLVALGPPQAVLTPETIRHAFGLDVLVQTHPVAGCPLVIAMPVGPSLPTAPPMGVAHQNGQASAPLG